MTTVAEFRTWALALPETSESPHFDLLSFRVKKKIFATLNAPHQRATLRFTPELQDVFSAISQGSIFPVPNKWGTHGWTHLNLATIEPALCQDALKNAWWETAPPRLRDQHPEFLAEE